MVNVELVESKLCGARPALTLLFVLNVTQWASILRWDN